MSNQGSFRMPHRYYREIDGVPVPIEEEEWRTTCDVDRTVAITSFKSCEVNTEFLALNHGYDDPPILYDTRIFGGPFDEAVWRYYTREEATQHHHEVASHLRVILPLLAKRAGWRRIKKSMQAAGFDHTWVDRDACTKK